MMYVSAEGREIIWLDFLVLLVNEPYFQCLDDGRPSTSPHQKFRVRKSPQQEKLSWQKQNSRSPLSPDASLKVTKSNAY